VATNNQKSNPFDLPERYIASSIEEEYDRNEFKQWVDNLPIGNVGQTARKLYDATVRLGRLDISPVERFEALEFVRTPLSHVLDSLASHYILDPLPLPKRERRIARLRQELLLKTVVAYKVVVDQFDDESFTGHLLHKRAHTEAIHRVLFYLGSMLLHSFQLYQGAPRHIWGEIHGIYRYAVDNELHGKEVLSEDAVADETLSTEDLYKQILLLALAGPYRLLKGEVVKLYAVLHGWAPLAEIVPLRQPLAADTSFLVAAGADQPPVRTTTDALESLDEGWVLITDKLERYLESEFGSPQEGRESAGAMRPQIAQGKISAELVVKLMLAWGMGSSRSAERSESPGQVVLACGLEVLYGLMGGEVQPDFEQRRLGFEVRSETVEDAFGKRTHVGHDEHLVFADEDLSKLAETELQIEPAASMVDPEHICTKVCEVFDRSTNGFHLVYAGAGDSRVRVGELVGISDSAQAEAGQKWQLGVIRWLRTKRSKWLEFGVELLQGDVQPVAITRNRGVGDITDYWCGFLQHMEDGKSILLMPPFYANSKDQIALAIEGETHQVHLNYALERTDSFAQYLFDFRKGAKASGAADAHRSETLDEEESQLLDEIDFETIIEDL
jgi:hypothetical protein